MITEGTIQPGAVPHINCLVYGQPKSGKTRFGYSFPDPYLIVTERPPNGLISDKPLPYVLVQEYSDIQRVLSEIKCGTRAANAKSIILDSVSDMTDMVKKAALLATAEKKMTYNSWGLAVDYLRETMRILAREIGSKKHVCVIARSQLDKDDLTGALTGSPETIGKFSQAIGGQFDLLLFSEQYTDPQGKKQWRLHTSTYKSWFPAGDGLGGFLNPEEPNDFDVIYAKICKGSEAKLKNK
jgi:hypothetical protein